MGKFSEDLKTRFNFFTDFIDENKVARGVGTIAVAAGGVGAAAGIGLKALVDKQNVVACETQLEKGQGCTATQTQDYAANQMATPLLVAAVMVGGVGAILRKMA